MPKLDTSLHIDMYRKGKRVRSIARRIRKAMNILLAKNDIYGLEWGNPDEIQPLRYVRDHFLAPYVTSNTVIVEIGQGVGAGHDTCLIRSRSMRLTSTKNY